MPINNESITLQEILMPKTLKSTCGKLSCLSTGKKSTSFIAHVFLEILQRYVNFLFWELCACLVTHTQNGSIKLWKTSMFICMPKEFQHSIPSQDITF